MTLDLAQQAVKAKAGAKARSLALKRRSASHASESFKDVCNYRRSGVLLMQPLTLQPRLVRDDCTIALESWHGLIRLSTCRKNSID